MAADVACPYVGLRPYADVDRAYFFGRQRDQRIVASNFGAASLTVLYGATGVGKTSVLEAGVIPILRAEPSTAVVVFREWQGAAVLAALKTRCIEAVSAVLPTPAALDLALPLDEFFLAAGRELGGPLLVVLDQFEEYFLYHPRADAPDAIDVELARAVNRQDVDANFLLSLREDSLSRLDRFRGRIPSLRRNELRLRHLDRDGAREAILEPLRIYRERNPGTPGPIEIEPELVEIVLDQIRSGQEFFGTGGTGRARMDGDDGGIETPYLQLVLTKLWAAEIAAKSRTLRTRTFLDELKGAKEVVHRHLDTVLADLRPVQRKVCARVFDKLVTPSGSKIAYPEGDLAEGSGRLAARVPATLDILTRKSILKPVPLASERRAFEIFHDVLARPILDWRRRYFQRQARNRWVVAGLAAVLFVASLLGYRSWVHWVETRPWGYLHDVSAGTAAYLTGDLAVVGRSTKNSRAQVDIPNTFVSRLHLTISRTLDVTDVRSLNGTTLNATPLPYGMSSRLREGDIVVLAGVAALEFRPIRYSALTLSTPSPPRAPVPAGWGLVIDGTTRRAWPLRTSRSFLEIDAENRIVPHEASTTASLVAVRLDGGTLFVEDLRDEFALEIFIKDTERDLRRFLRNVLPTGREVAVPTSASFRIKAVPFQIVPMSPDGGPPRDGEERQSEQGRNGDERADRPDRPRGG